ncbi:MAG: InlB B-repeat-containing protein [Oscillospiraceae bacterium]|nr:InlB B-repeat-containing protein [Oscillospiraceae bacterium]
MKKFAFLMALIFILGLLPISGVYVSAATSISDFTIIPGEAHDVDWSEIYDTLRPGQIWTDKSVYYPQDSLTDDYDGTVVITIYVWGRPYMTESGDYGMLGGNQEVTITTQIGDFQLEDSVYPAGVTFLEAANGVLQWSIPEALITDPDEPLAVHFYLYLEDRANWLTNFWYSTSGSFLEVKFEPGLDNPYYWTTEEVTYNAFDAPTMNWNNGTGLNSGTIVDNVLGITLSFGKNASPANQTAASVPWANTTYRNNYWAQNALVVGRPQPYYWHLYWVRTTPKIYIFTVHGLVTDVDGTAIDVVYEISLGGMGGNSPVAGSRTITSDVYFRRTFVEGDPTQLFHWDEEGFLVYSTPLIAQIMLIDEESTHDVYFGSLIIEKEFPPDGEDWRHLDWDVDDETLFTVRLKTDNDFYVVLEEGLAQNEFHFDGFTDRPELATTITFSVDVPAIIEDLPRYMSDDDAANNIPILYSVHEFFEGFFEPRDWPLVYERINVYYSLDYEEFYPEPPSFEIISEEYRTITILNKFEHGIGFLEVYKLMDGFPADWDVDYDTVFYIRIWDVYAQNYLLFDADREFEPGSPFYGTIWCIGNHEIGLTEPHEGRVMMEIPISRNQPVRLSNLWTWGSYQVVEVRQADAVFPQETQDPLLDPDWIYFWDNIADRTPFYLRTPAEWAESFAWLQNRIDNDWTEIRQVVTDAEWHAVPIDEWFWGVIYSENNFTTCDDPYCDNQYCDDPDHDWSNRLHFNQTIITTVTNRFKFHCGTLVFTKDLCDNAAAWGVDGDTSFFARVRADDGRILVFVPDGDDFRVIGYIEYNDGVFGTYQVLCPVGGANPPGQHMIGNSLLPGNHSTIIEFSANSSTRLIEVPSYPFGFDIYYTIEEAFPFGEPLGFLDSEYFMGEDEIPAGGFIVPHGETIDITIRNTFEPGNGEFIIFKELAGEYAAWDVDDTTEFFAIVERDSDEELLYFIFDAEEEVFVYVNANPTYFTIPEGEPQAVIPFSVENPAVLVGLSTDHTNYTVSEVGSDGDPLGTIAEIGFVANVVGPAVSGYNLLVTITNRFYPRPNIPTFGVIYDGNENTGGEVPEDDNEYLAGATVTVLGNAGTPPLTRTGHIFIGWNTQADGGGTPYVAGETFLMPARYVTLYAEWKPLFTVTYDGNGNTGGDVTIDDNDYIAGATVTVLGNVAPTPLIRTNYNFIGWNTQADGGGTQYAAGETFLMPNRNVTLYAQWENIYTPPTFTVTYNGNGNTGGSAPVDDNEYNTGAIVTVLGNTAHAPLVRTNYVFAGWNTRRNGSGTQYAAGATFTMPPRNVTLYAQWYPEDTFNVIYDGNGGNTTGTPPADLNDYYGGTLVTVLGSGTMSNPNYEFIGWNTEPNGSGTHFNIGDDFVMPYEDVTLYAQWSAYPTFEVIYVSTLHTSGVAPVDPNRYLEGATVTVRNRNTLARTDWDFIGWRSDDGTLYKIGDTFEMPARNVRLTAEWAEPPTYTITYDANDNDGGSAFQGILPIDENRYLPGSTATVRDRNDALGIPPISRLGYTLIGWNTASDGSGDSFEHGNSLVMPAGNVTLYAQWRRNSHSLIYDANGGTGTPPVDNGSYAGDGYETVVIQDQGELLRDRHRFIGWNTEPDGSGEWFQPDDTLTMPDSDVTLYAQWEHLGTPPPPPPPGPGWRPPPSYVPIRPIPPPTAKDFFVDDHIWYIRGYENTEIRPNNNITRAEIAMVFYRLLRPELRNFTPYNPFNDINGDEWFGLAVATLAYYNVFTGYEDGNFEPHSLITRREFAAVVSRFEYLVATNENPYSDVDSNDWARNYILSATQKGWFVGHGGMFRPSDNLTRAELVTAVNRVLNRHILLEDIPDDVFNFPDLDRTHWAYAAFMEATHTHEFERNADGRNETWTEILGTGLDAAYNQ